MLLPCRVRVEGEDLVAQDVVLVYVGDLNAVDVEVVPDRGRNRLGICIVAIEENMRLLVLANHLVPSENCDMVGAVGGVLGGKRRLQVDDAAVRNIIFANLGALRI